MALDDKYVIAYYFEQVFLDKDTGLPLAGGKLNFYRDSARNVPKEVFQLSGFPPNYTYTTMSAEITLSSKGTIQNSNGDNVALYFFPYDAEDQIDLYYVTCNSAGNIEQFTRAALPNLTPGTDPIAEVPNLNNQISNPQFTNVFINDLVTTSYAVTSASNQEFSFAPNWDFIISGTGSVEVKRIAITGNEHLPTSPPYVIDINVSSGISKCYLRQKFAYNSGLWSSTTEQTLFLVGTLIAKSESGTSTGIQMFYNESSGGIPQIIIDATVGNTAYSIINGITPNSIPSSFNIDSGEDGYVEIYVSLVSNSHIRLSSIQVIPTRNQDTTFIPYDINSSNREEAFQGDYFLPRANTKQIPSILVGWDFTCNPYQFGTSGNLATTPDYITDQTIAERGVTNNITWTRSQVTGGLQFTTLGTNDAFYLLQYLSKDQAKKILGNRLSSNVFAYKGLNGDRVTVRIYLFRAPSSAAFPILPNSLGNLSPNGEFVLTSPGWTLIPRSGLDIPQAELNSTNNDSGINSTRNDCGFSGWELTDPTQISDTDKFAIVATFGYADPATVITVNSISLIPGDLPCRPGVQSTEEVLGECQAFYETSYEPGVLPGTITSNYITFVQGVTVAGGVAAGFSTSFSIQFKQIKISTPTLTFYTPFISNGINLITGILYQAGVEVGIRGNNAPSTRWNLTVGRKNVLAFTNSAGNLAFLALGGTGITTYCSIAFNYVADARLGKI